VLANRRRRRLLAYLHDKDGDVASVVELTDYLAGDEADSVDDLDPDGVAVSLHHNDLPKLADIGIIEYDTRSQTVRYRGHEEI
jgi:predicted transcriptional regulator